MLFHLAGQPEFLLLKKSKSYYLNNEKPQNQFVKYQKNLTSKNLYELLKLSLWDQKLFQFRKYKT